MAITVNGVEITDAMIQAELPHHDDAPHAVDGAVQELILRELLLQAAKAKGLDASNPEEAIGTLLQNEVKSDDATEEECKAFYAENPQAFVRGEQAEASHILFTAENPTEAALVRAKAEGILNELKAQPFKFEALAREHSACPSGKQGGALGQFGRGQMVPEFDQAVFSMGENELLPQLVETQFGLHIIRTGKKTSGDTVSYDEVKDRLGEFLTETKSRRAMHEYLQSLVQAADIQGYELKPAA
ncbi:peptidyl-prolyl cis-trans isomerase C [Silvimonas terrae]|uniref:peptidylprolyl isomerase n=1 Tax=Silvimonas terrae TaxID=300266 RepID=A0A840RI22_9NEIS|nr:peptidylprolyl isomerase [Silvimonas terrae]MBB5192090.1 peptidyl-prolyl cis-trans isomerase C [Silvimonas terrae]